MEGRRIIAVLRSAGEFAPRHVRAMQRQLARWAPTARFTCLSDVAIPGVECIQLNDKWPDWWCKMALFRPEIRGGFLCTDLDNVFLGPLDDILAVDKYTTQIGESNALAYYPEEVRAAVWAEWVKDPEGHMRKWHPETTPNKGQFGDGGFVKSLMSAEQHWEELLPGQVLNLVKLRTPRHPHTTWAMPTWPLKIRDVPKDTRVLLCYRPWRPWTLPAFQRLYQEK